MLVLDVEISVLTAIQNHRNDAAETLQLARDFPIMEQQSCCKNYIAMSYLRPLPSAVAEEGLKGGNSGLTHPHFHPVVIFHLSGGQCRWSLEEGGMVGAVRVHMEQALAGMRTWP